MQFFAECTRPSTFVAIAAASLSLYKLTMLSVLHFYDANVDDGNDDDDAADIMVRGPP